MNKSNQPESNDRRQEFLYLMQETQKHLEQHVEQRLTKIEEDHKKDKQELMDRMDTYKTTIEGKIDGLDMGFRGNSRIGVFEQIRNMRFHIKIIFAALVLLFGLRIFGVSWDDWVEGIKGMWGPAKTVQVEKIPSSSAKDIVVSEPLKTPNAPE